MENFWILLYSSFEVLVLLEFVRFDSISQLYLPLFDYFFSWEALVESGIYHVLGLFESSWIILLKEKKDSGRAFCDEFSSLLFITSLYGIDDGRPCNETYAAGLDNGDARCNEMYARFGLIIVIVERWIMAHGNVELWKIVLLPDCDA